MSSKGKIVLVYSTKDDEPMDGGAKGWVANFNKFLSTLLYQITRQNPELILLNEENFDPASFGDFSIVICVATENLEKESQIIKVINQYGKYLKSKHALTVDGIARLFKVLKKPYDADKIFPELEDIISYDFFLIDPLTGDTQEFTRFFGNEAERSYWMKLVDMAYDMHNILQAKQKTYDDTDYENIPRDKTVYLASTGVDMVIQRDMIKRELIRHGYKVLPDHTLPKEIRSLDRMIRDDLDRCRLSIHMVGEDYGYKPKGSELSIVDIQNRVASDHTYQMVEKNTGLKEDEKTPFSRLIWVSPDLKNITERQKIFIEDLKSDAAALEEAEVLQISMQELKTIVREELVTGGRFKQKREFTGLKHMEVEDEGKMIYLIADKRDIHAIDELQEYLRSEGFMVVSPSYDGDLVDLRYIHQENLRRCDASIIYFGDATEEWIKTKLQDLLKAPGFGREKPLDAKAVYFCGKKNVNMEHYKKNNAMILAAKKGTFRPESLEPFLTKIANA